MTLSTICRLHSFTHERFQHDQWQKYISAPPVPCNFDQHGFCFTSLSYCFIPALHYISDFTRQLWPLRVFVKNKTLKSNPHQQHVKNAAYKIIKHFKVQFYCIMIHFLIILLLQYDFKYLFRQYASCSITIFTLLTLNRLFSIPRVFIYFSESKHHGQSHLVQEEPWEDLTITQHTIP